ncbi:MAG: hypothetical protein ACREN6_03260 [Gemmatimonadaceae bacterium]
MNDARPPMGGNRLGRLFCLTLFTPVRRQWVPVLRAAMFLGKWIPFAQNHILQFNFIRFVRWTIVSPELPFHGAPQVRDKLNYHYLFFESNFDGPWQHYIDAFAYCIPADIRFVWGRGPHFPGPPPAEPLKRWIAMNSMEGGTYYCAYENASTRMVAGALVVKDRFQEFLAESRGLEPAAFKTAYDGFLGDVQRHL